MMRFGFYFNFLAFLLLGFTFEGQKFDVGELVFTPDNSFLIAGSADTTIKFYDLKTGREARTLTQQPQAQ